jgi:putative DNA primase/helicase
MTAVTATAPQIDLDQARRFLAALDPSPAAKFAFQSFAERDGKAGGANLDRVRHGTLSEHAAELARLNDAGAGIFVTVNETDGKGRKAENATRVRAMFMDWDAGNPLELIATLRPVPHIVVESSPGKAHAYWRVSDCALDEFKPTQQALATRHGADKAVCDLPRVLRLPGFIHQKGDPFLARLVSSTDTPPYTLEEIKAGLLQVGQEGAKAQTPAAAAPVVAATPAPAPATKAQWTDEQVEIELKIIASALAAFPAAEWDSEQFWLRQLMAVNSFGEEHDCLAESYALVDKAARVSKHYDEEENRYRWGSFANKKNGLGIGTLYFDADKIAKWKKPPEWSSPLREVNVERFERFLETCTDKATDTAPEELSELGNAARFARQHGENVRWCIEFRKWLLWDRQRWIFAEAGEEMRHAKTTVLSIHGEAAQAETLKQAEAIAKHALRSQSRHAIEGMLSLTQKEPGIPISQCRLDSNPMLLGVSNGVIDLSSGAFRAPSRLDYITKRAHVEYDGRATCPRWVEFLQGIFGKDDALIAYIQRAAGYSLTGSTAEQCLFFLYGTGSNGKSTFLGTLKALLGDYAMQCAADSLMVKRGDGGSGANGDIARLRGARLVSAVEAEEGKRIAEAQIKQMTGGDTVTARFLYQEIFEYVPQFKLWLAANHKPTIRGNDLGIWRRIHLVPFTVTIGDDKKDKRLPEKLAAEGSGILNWALEGCAAWQRLGGLNPPAAVTGATEAYREEMDVFGAWIDECCLIERGAEYAAAALYAGYRSWSESEGIYPLSHVKFANKLKERGFEKARKIGGQMYRGLVLAM